MLTQLKALIVEAIKKMGSEEDLRGVSLESPKRAGHGHLAMPVFALAKKMGKAPPLVAQEISEKIKIHFAPGVILKVEALQGFVNFHFTDRLIQDIVAKKIFEQGSGFGGSNVGTGKTMVIDFSSPNVAKPMHVGHLRATVIGQAIVNLAKSQGYHVIGLNHLGDWGVQFGNLAWAYQNWGGEYPFAEKPFESLNQLYVRFHQQAENDSELAKKGAETFLLLEKGDPDVAKIWKLVVEISLKEYSRLWNLLGVKHDLVRGESFYNDKLKSVESELEKKGLLVESEGAMVVRLDEENIAPCLIRKTDGASLYATRDLASAIYRKKELNADLNVYVVGAEQTLHFRQVFLVLKKMGYQWSESCHHVGFGMYRFKDIGKMSSRSGKVVLLEDVLSRAIEMVKQIIAEKNPALEDKDRIAEQVGVGAVVFNDLMNDRNKNVEFDWDKILDFEGDSGPYVQYCYVRCESLLKKYGKELSGQIKEELQSLEEREILRHIMAFPDVISSSFDTFKPHMLAGYLLELCKLFGQYYNKHRILGGEESLIESRMNLVKMIQLTLGRGLGLLNIQAPKAM